MAENEEFRRLRSEHQGYERELDALKVTTSLSADQHWRMSELKKLKLMAKDRMEPPEAASGANGDVPDILASPARRATVA